MKPSNTAAGMSGAAPIEAMLVSPLKPTRPNGLTVICVIVLVLAGLGILSAFAQSINLAFGEQMQKVWGNIGTAGAPPQMKEAQQRMMSATQKLTDEFFVVNVLIVIGQWLIAIGFLYGGIQCLRLKAPGREVLCWTLLAACIFAAAAAIPQIMLQFNMRPIMEDYMRALMPPGGNAQQRTGARMGAAFAHAGIMAGIVMLICWTLIKVGFYGYSFRYLSRTDIRNLFSHRRGA